MLCLNCGAEMMSNQVNTRHGQISYDACEECGSLWLDSGELDKMAFQVEGSIEFCSQAKDEAPDPRPKRCPRCRNVDLDRVRFLEFTDIILHRCGNCGGFWLDGGELNLIDQELKKIMPVQGRGFSDFVNHVHVPYWYKQIRRRSSETDFTPAIPPFPGARDEKSTGDICPDCGATLDMYRTSSAEFEGCPRCRGVWAAQDAIRRLKNEAKNGSLRWLNDEVENLGQASARISSRKCIRCANSPMISVLFGKSSVMIDWCPRCRAVWIPGGELKAIIEYLGRERVQMKPGEIEKEAVDDLKRLPHGGTEGKAAEIEDAASAAWAFVNGEIFSHPSVLNFLRAFGYLKGI